MDGMSGNERVEYGNDPFPYTKPIPKPDESDLAFTEKMKFMGKTSKQKFAMMARKFARKGKGAKGL